MSISGLSNAGTSGRRQRDDSERHDTIADHVLCQARDPRWFCQRIAGLFISAWN